MSEKALGDGTRGYLFTAVWKAWFNGQDELKAHFRDWIVEMIQTIILSKKGPDIKKHAYISSED